MCSQLCVFCLGEKELTETLDGEEKAGRLPKKAKAFIRVTVKQSSVLSALPGIQGAFWPVFSTVKRGVGSHR